MNYSEMSDFEIDRAVALHLCLNIKAHHVDSDDNPVFVIVGEKFTREKLPFQPCNSWADAGPIIQEESISLIKYDTNQWRSRSRKCLAGFIHINPLRAAMIVFLMMQEQK